MAKLSYGLDHVSKGGMIELVAKNWESIGFSILAENCCKRCLVCALHNSGKATKTIQAAFSTPVAQFQHLMMDYIELAPARGYKYCLVIVDISIWIEASSASRGGGKQLLQLCSIFTWKQGTPKEPERYGTTGDGSALSFLFF